MIYILVMAIIMFITFGIILFLGIRKNTPNFLLWAGIPLFKGLEWLIEFIADYRDENSLPDLFILNRLEIVFAFIAVFFLIAVCMEYNHAINPPFGKLTTLLFSSITFFYLFIIEPETFEGIENTELFEDSIFISDPNRLMYGLIIPLFSIIFLLVGYYFHQKNVKKGFTQSDPKLKNKIGIISILILIPAFFNGLDYNTNDPDLDNVLFLLLRALTMLFFISLPIIAILTSNIGLKEVIFISKTGIPIFAFDFFNRQENHLENHVCLTAGFISALTNFSEELSKDSSTTLRIQANNFYFLIFKLENHIITLQSSSYTKQLETQFHNLIQQINNTTVKLEDNITKDQIEGFTLLIQENFQKFF